MKVPRFARVGRLGWLPALLLIFLVSCTMPDDPAPGIATPAGRTTATSLGAQPAVETPVLLPSRAPATNIPLSLDTLPTFGPTPSVRPPYCGDRASIGEPITYPSLVAQAWASDQVIMGTVEAQEARWKVVGGYPYIVTYSLLHVEERVRGRPFDSLYIATPGGTLEGCTQRSNSPTIRRGEKDVLFLLDDNYSTVEPMPIYLINGGEAGRQSVTGDGSLIMLLASLRQALGQTPPPDLRADFVVPLDRAPIAPVATPRP